jgi:hypothetical protein
MRRLTLLGLLAAAVGCDAASSAARKAEAEKAADRAKEAAGQAGDAARENVVKPIREALPGIEAKMKTMAGDALALAKEKYEAVKRLLAEFETAPADKLKDVGERLTQAFADLKRQVGL